MGRSRMNLKEVVSTLEAEKPLKTKLRNRYAGLDFARYPRHVTIDFTVTCEWLAKYEALGGKYDSCGCWGYSPEEIENLFVGGFTPEECAWANKIFGRVDYSNEAIVREAFRDYGFTIETLTFAVYRKLAVGKSTKEALERAGFICSRCYFYYSKKSTVQWALDLMTEVTEGIRKIVTHSEYFVYDDYEESTAISLETKNPVGQYYLSCLRKGQKRKDIKWECEKAYYRLSVDEYGKYSEKAWCYWAGKKQVFGTWRYTSVKEVKCSPKGGFLWRRNDYHQPELNGIYRTRLVGGIRVCKIGHIVFAWQDNFANHVEAATVKAAVELLSRRQKVKGGIIRLQDVRNDIPGTAGYCLSGTQNFLRGKMPHIYNLIKDYRYWSEVPEEIMLTEFMPLKDLFSGGYNPFA